MPEPSDRPLTERHPVSAGVVALWAGIGAVALVLVAYVAYRQLLHYERRAIEHVPVGAELALRINLEQVVLFDPVRRHLLPLVDRAAVSISEGEPPPSRLLRLREAGLNLGMELRELVFAREPGGGWSLALGGLFAREPLLPRIEAVLRAEPGARLRVEGAMIIFEPSGAALAQAEDGVLILASDAAMLARALPANRGYEGLGLRRDGAASLGALGSWLRALSPPAEGGPLASNEPLRVSVRLELGDPLELYADIEHAAPSAVAAARRELDGWLGTPADGSNFAPQADWGGERALSARARLSQASPTQIEVRASWERAELDRATKSLAAWLDARIHASGPVAR